METVSDDGWQRSMRFAVYGNDQNAFPDNQQVTMPQRAFFLTVAVIVLSTTAPLHAQIWPIPDGPGARCFDSWTRDSERGTRESVDMIVAGDTLRGTLFLPESTTSPVPAMLLLPGGGTDANILMITPTWFGRHLAHCGMAALVFHKRGTGESAGDASTMTMEDLLMDAEHAVGFLKDDARIDAGRIGVMGFSQGGRLAPVLAARVTGLSTAVSVSGPLVSVMETRLYALENSFLRAGVRATMVDSAMVFWRRHLSLFVEASPAATGRLDADLRTMQSHMPRGLLPPTWAQREQNEIMNSMGQDVMHPLSSLQTPWLALYGADDPIVPVAESLKQLHSATTVSGNDRVRVLVYPEANHNMVHVPSREDTPFQQAIFDWLFDVLQPH